MQAFILMIGPAGFMVVLQPTTKLNILMKIYLMLLQLHCIFCYLTFPRRAIKTVYIYMSPIETGSVNKLHKLVSSS